MDPKVWKVLIAKLNILFIFSKSSWFALDLQQMPEAFT